MSADIVEKPAEHCPESSLQEIGPPAGEVPVLDRDEILRKRRERRKKKREEIRKVKSLMKQQKVKIVSEKELDRMKKLVQTYDQNVVVKVDLLLELEKAAAPAPAATTAPARPGIVRKTKPKGKERYFRNKSKKFNTRKVNKGKKREVPKKSISTLKKKLLQFRKEKMEKKMEIVEQLNKLSLNTTKLPEAVEIPDSPKEVPKDAELSPTNAPKVDEPMLDIEKELKEKSDETPPASVHSRKFRPYCDNTTSKKICELTEKFLKKIFTYQKRAYEKNVIKASAHRRYVYGFHEVKRQVEINKAKLVIIAPDCEPSEFPGGFEDIIKSLKDKCKERNIPYLFSIRRRSLAYSLFKKVPVSCVAVLNYDGAQELYQELMDTLTAERAKYTLLFRT